MTTQEAPSNLSGQGQRDWLHDSYRVRKCIKMHVALSATLTDQEICWDQDTTGESLCIFRDLFQHVMGWVTHMMVNKIIVNTMNSEYGDDSCTFLNKGAVEPEEGISRQSGEQWQGIFTCLLSNAHYIFCCLKSGTVFEPFANGHKSTGETWDMKYRIQLDINP